PPEQPGPDVSSPCPTARAGATCDAQPAPAPRDGGQGVQSLLSDAARADRRPRVVGRPRNGAGRGDLGPRWNRSGGHGVGRPLRAEGSPRRPPPPSQEPSPETDRLGPLPILSQRALSAGVHAPAGRPDALRSQRPDSPSYR